MTYCLMPGEPVAAGVRRIAREQAAYAAGRLREPEGNADEAVHDARKSIKKLRALLRLMRAELGPIATAENAHLRDVGRSLSELRDAAATLEIIEAMEKRLGPAAKGLAAVRRRLLARKKRMEASSKAAEAMHAAAAALEAFSAASEGWPLQRDGFAALEKGLARTFRAGKKTLARVHKQPDDANYHEWRKRVKDHWYHMRLLGGASDRDIDRRQKQLEILSERLGDDHNIVVLRTVIEAEPRTFRKRPDVIALLDLLQEWQAGLRDKALKQGDRLYAGKTRRLMRRLEAAWTTGIARAKTAPGRKPPARRNMVTAPSAAVA